MRGFQDFPKGFAIAFEGPDGAGKTLFVRRAAELFRQAGFEVKVSREPGFSLETQFLRDYMLDPTITNTAGQEALLVNAERTIHANWITNYVGEDHTVACTRSIRSEGIAQYEHEISPLGYDFRQSFTGETGDVVSTTYKKPVVHLLDRFGVSTFAYQGAAGGVDTLTLERLHKTAVGKFVPYAHVIVAASPDVCRERIESRDDNNAFDEKDEVFHAAIHDFYSSRSPELGYALRVVGGNKPRLCWVDNSAELVDEQAIDEKVLKEIVQPLLTHVLHEHTQLAIERFHELRIAYEEFSILYKIPEFVDRWVQEAAPTLVGLIQLAHIRMGINGLGRFVFHGEGEWRSRDYSRVDFTKTEIDMDLEDVREISVMQQTNSTPYDYVQWLMSEQTDAKELMGVLYRNLEHVVSWFQYQPAKH